MANNKKKYTDEYLTDMLEKENYKFISAKRISERVKVYSICPSGNEYEFFTYNWNKGKRCGCSNCQKNSGKNIWDEDALGKLCDSIGIKFIGFDPNNRRNIITKCKNNNINTQTVGNFVRFKKCTCIDCGGRIAWTDKNIKKAIEPYGYTFVSKERDENEKLKAFYNTLCPSGNPYKLEIHKFLNGRRCNCEDCAGRITWTNKRIKDELTKHGLEYISHTITRLYDKNITFRCKNGEVSTSTIHNLIARNWACSCEKCTGKIQFTKERIIDELNRAGYVYINHYYDDTGHLRVESECPHGHYYNCNFWNFVHQNVRCDQCKLKSRGETQIYDDFNNVKIKFSHEYIFDDCRYVNPLKFDFIVFDESDNISFACEYDGIQHFEPSRFGSQSKEEAVECFKQSQIRDEIKNKYCKTNKIPLIRVPYTVKFQDVFNFISDKLSQDFNIKIDSLFYLSNKLA